MEIHKIVVGPLATNCFIVFDKDTLEAAVVDPGADAPKIKSFISKGNLIVKFVINTHGHIDHIASNDKFNAPLFIHELDEYFLKNPAKNLSAMFGLDLEHRGTVNLLKEGDIIRIGKGALRVLHTPGHTPGSICLVADKDDFVITGDTLFAGGVGRSDFPYASENDLISSIKDKLFKLDGNLKIYPGHGPDSTIKKELTSNPFII